MHIAAALSIQLNHERTYAPIYGSQLRLMVLMNNPGGLDIEGARSVYTETTGAWPDRYKSYTFEQWIGFLTASGLCTLDASNHYQLTPYGRGFLKYILDRRLSSTKPF